VQNKLFSGNKILKVRGGLLDLSRPKVMGILNITPDSFYKGSRVQQRDEAVRYVEKMVADGADFLDVGGYSSRPGAEDISAEEEWARVFPAISAIRQEFPTLILSIDTFRASIAERAINEGCDIVNDISAGQSDTNMPHTVARMKVPYIIMHMRGTPQTMTQLTGYENVVKEAIDYFHPLIHRLQQLGIADLIIDPGFGFAKTVDQNFELLHHLHHLAIFEKPILAGLSRKSMIWKILQTTADQALNGTTALHMAALLKGVSILRVHDVKEAKEVITLAEKLTTQNPAIPVQ
jgi:dihydropteroate synthase